MFFDSRREDKSFALNGRDINEQCFNVKEGGTYSYHGVLKF
jgi:hypothetical protein